MKTLKQVNAEIESVLKTVAEKKKVKPIDSKQMRANAKEAKRLLGTLPLLKQYSLLLEKSNLTEEYITSEINRLNNRIDLIFKDFKPLDESRFQRSEVTKHRKNFEKEMGVIKIKKQLTMLRYLIK